MRTEPGGALNIWLGGVRAWQGCDDVEPGIERQGLGVAIACTAAGQPPASHSAVRRNRGSSFGCSRERGAANFRLARNMLAIEPLANQGATRYFDVCGGPRYRPASAGGRGVSAFGRSQVEPGMPGP